MLGHNPFGHGSCAPYSGPSGCGNDGAIENLLGTNFDIIKTIYNNLDYLKAILAAGGIILHPTEEIGLLATEEGDFFGVIGEPGAEVFATLYQVVGGLAVVVNEQLSPSGVLSFIESKLSRLGILLWQIAKGDFKDHVTLSMVANSNIVTSPIDRFTEADLGKSVMIPAAKAGVGSQAERIPLAATILEINGPKEVRVSATATFNVTSEECQYGTDDTVAIQAAIDLASLTGRPILCGGSENQYLVAGQSIRDPADNGTHWASIDGPTYFNRHALIIRSNVHFFGSGMGAEGTGARFILSGGRNYPGGMFGHAHWLKNRVENISFYGVEWDGNIQNQVEIVYPAGRPWDPPYMWQHGHGMVVFGIRNVLIEKCCIHGFRGAGVNLGQGDGETNYVEADPWASGKIKIINCTFFDNWSHDTGITLSDVEITGCLYRDGKYPSRWVHAASFEKLGQNDHMHNIRCHHNVFDFRFGTQPPESNAMYASDDSDVLPTLRSYRRAASFSYYYNGFPDNTYNGTMRSVSFDNNVIYEGNVDADNWVDIEISNNKFFNYSDKGIEDDHSILSAIHVTQHAPTPPYRVEGLYGVKITGNRIEQSLPGFNYGITVESYEEIDISDNVIKYAPQGGIRINGCGGRIKDNEIFDVGRLEDTELAADHVGENSSGIVVFGSKATPLRITDNVVHERRVGGAKRCKFAVYINNSIRPLCRVERNDAIDTLLIEGTGVPIRDVSNTTRQVDNIWYSNAVIEIIPFIVPTIRTADAVIQNSLTIEHKTGEATLNLKGVAGQRRVINFFDDTGLEAQLLHEADGGIQFILFENGSFTAVPLAVRNDGHLVLLATWDKPLELPGAMFVWVGESGVLRVKNGQPTSVTDGTPIATQVLEPTDP